MEKAKGELEKNDRLMQDPRKECQEAMEVTKERDIQRYKSAVDKTRKELEAAKSDLEFAKKRVAELEERLAKEKQEDLRVSEKQTSQAQDVKNQEINEFTKEAKGFQKIDKGVESEWGKAVINAASVEAEYQEKIAELEEKLQTSYKTQLSQKEDLDKTQKERDDFQEKCTKLTECIEDFVKEFGQSMQYFKSESSSAASVSHENVATSTQQKLTQLSAYVQRSFQSWFNEIKHVQEEMEETRKLLATIGPFIGQVPGNQCATPQQGQQCQGPATSTSVHVRESAQVYRQSLKASLLHPPSKRQRFPEGNSIVTVPHRPSYLDMVLKDPPTLRGSVEDKSNKFEAVAVELKSLLDSAIFKNPNENTVFPVPLPPSQGEILKSHQFTGNPGEFTQLDSGGSNNNDVVMDSDSSTGTGSTLSTMGGEELPVTSIIASAQSSIQESTENTRQVPESPSKSGEEL